MNRRAFSVAIFARHSNEILLIKHARLGTWLPVGGEIESGETPLDAARRELREETGLEGDFGAPLGVDGSPPGFFGYEEHQAGSKGLHMNFAFVADVTSREVVPNGEFTEHRWIGHPETVDCPKNVRELVTLALSPSPEALIEVARRWLAAFNAQDLDALLALYHPDCVHTSPKLRVREPETAGRIAGKDRLRAWWADSMQRLPQLRYEERHLTASGSRVFMEYDRVLPGEETLIVAEVLVLGPDRRITSSHVFHG